MSTINTPYGTDCISVSGAESWKAIKQEPQKIKKSDTHHILRDFKKIHCFIDCPSDPQHRNALPLACTPVTAYYNAIFPYGGEPSNTPQLRCKGEVYSPLEGHPGVQSKEHPNLSLTREAPQHSQLWGLLPNWLMIM